MVEENSANIFAGRKYTRALGRRKSATAVVKIYAKGKGIFLVNGLPPDKYFSYGEFIEKAQAPLKIAGISKEIDVKADVRGGGSRSQAEATRLALSRALVSADSAVKPALRQLGFLTVDSRVKERKKPGLKRARRAPQWSKR